MTSRWRAWADFGIAAGSWLPAILWGVAFAILVRGLPVDANHHVALSVGDVLNAYTLLGGLATAGLFLFHGAVFIVLKTADAVRDDALRVATTLALPVTVLVGGFGVVDPARIRQELDVGGAARCGRRSTDRRCAGTEPGPGGLGVLVHHHRGRDGRGADPRRPLPEPCSVHPEPRLERHDLQRLVEPLHVEDHDVGGGDLRAVGGRVPGLDVLGLPQAHLR